MANDLIDDLRARVARILPPPADTDPARFSRILDAYHRGVVAMLLHWATTIFQQCRTETGLTTLTELVTNFMRLRRVQLMREMLAPITAQLDGELHEDVRNELDDALTLVLEGNAADGLLFLAGLYAAAVETVPWIGATAEQIGLPERAYTAGVPSTEVADRLAAAAAAEHKASGSTTGLEARGLDQAYALLEAVFKS